MKAAFKSLKSDLKAQVQQFTGSSSSGSFGGQQPLGPAVPPHKLSERDVFRFRKQRGVNLGSWFVLEKWITDEPYRNAAAPGRSDLDVAKGGNAKQIWEAHWDSWITEKDFQWLAQKGINTVRLPVGYYHMSNPLGHGYLDGTDFAGLGPVFDGAWHRILAAIQTAERHGLGVLIDLHAAPGKQNNDDHSGTSAPSPALFQRARNLEVTSHALRFLASAFRDVPNVVGIELLNEPANHGGLQGWYERTLAELRTVVGPGFPLVIGDAWDLNWYAQIVGKRDDVVVVDHHLYRCFTSEDHGATAWDHAGRCKAEYLHMLRDAKAKSGGHLMVGEWSAALNPASLPGDWNELRKMWCRGQLEMYEETTASWFFWTLKKKEGDHDGGWSFYEAVKCGIMPDWVGGKRGKPSNPHPPEDRKKHEAHQAFNGHSSYWSSHPPPTPPEHWRFGLGFEQGWDDAVLFAYFPSSGPAKSRSEVGYERGWVKGRAAEHAHERGPGPGIWEFEAGWAQGYAAAMRAIG